MATLKKRLHRKNDANGYDVIHFETEACLVKTADGSDVETVLSNKAAKDHTHSQYSVNGHIHDNIHRILDYRNDGTGVNDYYDQIKFMGIKTASALGLEYETDLVWLIGLCGWVDNTGGPSHEIAFGKHGVYWRRALDDFTGWDLWNILIGDFSIFPRSSYNSETKRASVSNLMRTGGYNIKSWDFNNLVTEGIYECGADEQQTNTPYGNGGVHFFVLVLVHSSSWIRQIAYDVRSWRTYTRSMTNGTWSGWVQMLDAGSEVIASGGYAHVGGFQDNTNQCVYLDNRLDDSNLMRIQMEANKNGIASGAGIAYYTAIKGTWKWEGRIVPVQWTAADPGAGSALPDGTVIYVYE